VTKDQSRINHFKNWFMKVLKSFDDDMQTVSAPIYQQISQQTNALSHLQFARHHTSNLHLFNN